MLYKSNLEPRTRGQQCSVSPGTQGNSALGMYPQPQSAQSRLKHLGACASVFGRQSVPLYNSNMALHSLSWQPQDPAEERALELLRRRQHVRVLYNTPALI